MIVAYLVVTGTEALRQHIEEKLQQLGYDYEDLLVILRDMIAHLKQELEEEKEEEEEDEQKAKEEGQVDKELQAVSEHIDQSYLQTLIQWSAVLSSFHDKQKSSSSTGERSA